MIPESLPLQARLSLDSTPPFRLISHWTRLHVANSNHSHLPSGFDSAGLAASCTFVSAIASPIGNSSKRPPRSLPSRRREHPLRSRSGSPTDSVRGSDAVRAGNSHWTSSSGRRHDGAWSCCPIAWRLHPDSKSRRPSGAVSRSSALLLATTKPWRPRETDADIVAGSRTLLGTPPPPRPLSARTRHFRVHGARRASDDRRNGTQCRSRRKSVRVSGTDTREADIHCLSATSPQTLVWRSVAPGRTSGTVRHGRASTGGRHARTG